MVKANVARFSKLFVFVFDFSYYCIKLQAYIALNYHTHTTHIYTHTLIHIQITD